MAAATLTNWTHETMARIDAELGSDSSFVTTTSREKSIKNGTIMLIVVFCVSLGCLWFMIKKTTPQTAIAKTAR